MKRRDQARGGRLQYPIRRRLSAAPLKPSATRTSSRIWGPYPSTPVGGPIEAHRLQERHERGQAIRRRLSAAPLKRAGDMVELAADATIRRRLSAAPLKPAARRETLVDAGAYPSTPVGGPIEARTRIGGASTRPPIRRRLSAAPLKLDVGGHIAVARRSIRRRLSAAPLKRDPGRDDVEAGADYPSTPVGGPIEAHARTARRRRRTRLSVDACRRPH